MPGINPAERSFDEMYRLMTTSVVPRPIGWVSTTSADGTDNIAPFSHFTTACPHPPVVMFSTGYRDRDDRTLKDTTRNALDTGEFVVNLVTEPLFDQMDATSASLDPDRSEFDFADIERGKAEQVTPPLAAAAAVNMECSLYDSYQVYNNTVVLGEVEYVHVDESVMTDGKIDMRKIDAVGRLGGPYYTSIGIDEDLQRQYYGR